MRIASAVLLCTAAAAGVLSSADRDAALAALLKPRTQTPLHAHDPIGSVQGLIGRLLGAQYVSAFELEVITADPATGHDVFELDAAASSAVAIRGNSGVAIAAGLHAYLKQYCNASIAWGKGSTGNQLATVPQPSALPLPAPARTVRTVKLSYAYNVCTYGYTMPWWTFDADASARTPCRSCPPDAAAVAAGLPTGSSITWREELDRLALWGVNTPLAAAGQESVFARVYEGLGLSAASYVDSFITGHAFAPWRRMGNIQRLDNPGGGAMAAMLLQQEALQLLILQEARAFGMQPVLPGFAGHVPDALAAAFPNASVQRSASWNGFNVTYGETLLLDPTDPLFARIGAAYYRELVATYGLNPGADAKQLYNCDSFNEQNPSSSNATYLRDVNAAIYGAMAGAVNNSVFVMQGWLFLNAASFWTPANIEAFLSGVPDDRMIVLDLFTDSIPVWSEPGVNSYFGKPWVWNTLLIFGGRRGIYGNLTRVSAQPLLDLAAPGSTMVGLGITPEATEMAPVVWDLFFEAGWSAAPINVSAWLARYVERRYGVPAAASPSLQAAWALLRDGPLNMHYDYGTTAVFCPLQYAPQLTLAVDRAGPSTDAVLGALRLFIAAARNGEVSAASSPTFSYDLVDLARQVACNAFTDLGNVAGAEYLRSTAAPPGAVNTSAIFGSLAALQASLIADLDALLGSDTNYLLGHWTADARLWASPPGNATYAGQLEEDGRNIITVWGFPGSGVADYAAKNGWAGLVRGYYGSRWALHSRYVMDAAVSGQPVDWAAYEDDLTALEQSWLQDRTAHPTTPSGDALAAAEAILSCYASGNVTNYAVSQNTDAVSGASGAPVDIIQATTTDVAALAALCDADAACAGFNSNGWVKNATATRIASPGTALYVKIQRGSSTA